jgi:NADH-quinone oxidoreductase subunit L
MMAVSLVIALIGIGLAYLFYVKDPALPGLAAARWRRLYKLVYNKYYVDEVYQVLFVNFLKWAGRALWRGVDEFVIDGTINGIAYCIGMISGTLRKIQTGVVQNYAFSMVIGGVVLVAYYVIRAIFY